MYWITWPEYNAHILHQLYYFVCKSISESVNRGHHYYLEDADIYWLKIILHIDICVTFWLCQSFHLIDSTKYRPHLSAPRSMKINQRNRISWNTKGSLHC
jgi:hypothetical protein